ncbi:MAG: methionyl-tRNA formyltransferase [Thermodesulfobacteriota bacterium]
MRIVFMGTPDFAIPSLRALIESGRDVVGVVTQPDKPKGRGRKLEPPPIKALAERHGIRVLQPAKIKTDQFYKELSELRPDLICVAAYGKILPKNILDLPTTGCINVHASLLPKLRGAAPINWALIRGDTVTGITTMLMDEGMDTGDMLLKRELPIEEDDTAGSLSERLSLIGGELLIETLDALKENKLNPIPQNDDEATYASMLKKEMGRIDWSLPAGELRNFIRGMTPWPGAYMKLEGKLLKIFSAAVSEGSGAPGEALKSEAGELLVATGAGALKLLELQIEGGKRLSADVFLRGRKIGVGTVLGI